MEYRSRHHTEPESALPGFLDDARRVFAAAATDLPPLAEAEEQVSPEFEKLRWFPLPSEVLRELRAAAGNVQ